MCEITVFTPTYNRCEYIDKLYNSLTEQSCTDFEWLIIDQGCDGTEKKIEKYKKENKLRDIRYFKTPDRKGINRSYNDALEKAKGKLFFKVDDDDYLTSDALSTICEWEKSISDKDMSFAGVSGLRAYPDGRIIGPGWKGKGEFIDATGLERRKYGLTGDKAEAYYTDVLRKYGPLPEFEGETLTFESLLYDKIAYQGLKIRWFNRIIYFTKYLEGGQTKTTRNRLKDNLNTYQALLEDHLRYKSQPLKHLLKNLCRYSEMCREKKMSYEQACGKFQHGKCVVWICWCISLLTKHIKPRGKNSYE